MAETVTTVETCMRVVKLILHRIRQGIDAEAYEEAVDDWTIMLPKYVGTLASALSPQADESRRAMADVRRKLARDRFHFLGSYTLDRQGKEPWEQMVTDYGPDGVRFLDAFRQNQRTLTPQVDLSAVDACLELVERLDPAEALPRLISLLQGAPLLAVVLPDPTATPRTLKMLPVYGNPEKDAALFERLYGPNGARATRHEEECYGHA